MNDVPAKNYVKLLIIIIITIFIALLLSRIYQVNNNKTSIMYNFVSEIKEKDLVDYLNEKGTVVIYLGDKTNLKYQQFEKELSDKIKENNLKESFVYLNIPDLSENFKKIIAKNYNRDINLTSEPIMIEFVDHQIKDIIYINVDNYNLDELINLEDVK